MFKKILGFIIIAAVVIGGVYLYVHSRNVPVVNPVFTTTTTSGAPTFTIVMKNISDDGSSNGSTPASKGAYQIDAEYPVVSGLSNPAANELINKTIFAAIQDDIDNFKQDAISNPSNAAADTTGDQSTLSLVTATSTPRTIPLISFTVDQEIYSAGAAHPGHQIDAFNFDPTTGKALTLDDLFMGNYLKALSDYSRTALQTQLGADADQTQINQGTVATADNFNVVVPEDDGVHVLFNEYQVASYAAGPQEVIVPYDVLRAVIKSTGPLKGLK